MRYGEKEKKSGGNIGKIIIVFFILLILGAFFSFFFIYAKNLKKRTTQREELKSSYKKLFNQKNYLELIEKMDKELKESPFSAEYLIYRGYSYFFLGEEEKGSDRQKKFFILSLVDLRKSMAIGITNDNLSNLYFCIGKIYYYFGDAYYRLSVEYLKKSLNLGNKRKDLFYILGLIYSYLGNYEDSILSFRESLKIEENDLVLLAIGITYHKKSDFENSKNYLAKVMKISKEPKIREKSLQMYGEILFEEKKYEEAVKYFDEVIDLNENNSNAYFFKGEICFINNNPIKARAFWRKTLEIDPSHIRALKRIYR